LTRASAVVNCQFALACFLLRSAGRDPRSIAVVAAPVAAEPAVIAQYEDAGADEVVVFVMPAGEEEMLAELEQIAAKIIR
jgi:hypothetical protein